ncbi:MAG: peptidoglycan DD-metalloendopeptidase family protein, partial [Duncaniella sp.]|nr:peptidoglycan DD-metalloendopeptidase family protein [Duncaniella sp.]
DIQNAIEDVSQQRQHLTGLRHNQDKAYRQAEEARRKLAQQQGESEQMVQNLRKQDSQLRAELARQKKQAQALDRELDRLIAAEQERIARQEAERKRQSAKNTQKGSSKNNTAKSGSVSSDNANASEASASAIASARAETRTAAEVSEALSGTFAQNKGKLLFPVSGRYKIVRQFGRQPHPTQRHVMTDNSGIDIEIPSGTTARAVFDGTVSAIFRQDGFHTIIMLRHGKYLTVYAGLATSAVRQGQKVKAGQPLGTIYSDPADDNRTILHFEVRDERQKLNPTAWVR